MNDLQRTGVWFQERMGHLTASKMACALDFLKNGKESKARYDYKIQLVGERMTDVLPENFVTDAMKHGIAQEPFGRMAYEAITGQFVTDAPFIKHPEIEYFGASPDGLVGRDGLLEIKAPTTSKHVAWALAGVVPDEHKPQMLAQIACTRRQWVDFVSFDPRMPPPHRVFIRRFTPTHEEVEAIEDAARKFLAEVDALFEQLTTMEMVA